MLIRLRKALIFGVISSLNAIFVNQALADDTCFMNATNGERKKFTGAEYIEHALGSPEFDVIYGYDYVFTALLDFMPFCSEAYTNDFLNALSDAGAREFSSANINKILVKGSLSSQPFFFARQLVLFDRPAPMKTLVDRIISEAQSGSVQAMDVLIGLDTYVERELASDSFNFAHRMPYIAESFSLQTKSEFEAPQDYIPKPNVAEIIDHLASAADDIQDHARESGSAIAHIRALGSELILFDACDNSVLNEDVRLNFIEDPTKTKIIEDFRRHVARYQSPGSDKPGGVANIAIMTANIVSDCYYSATQVGSYGVNDPDLAREMIYRAAHIAHGSSIGERTAVALALAIDGLDNSNAERFIAAGRLLAYGAQEYVLNDGFNVLEIEEFYENLLPRFSRDSIRETQRVLKEYGFYTSAIDGIPGPAFRRALVESDRACTRDTYAAMPKLCIGFVSGRELRAQPWLKPYLQHLSAYQKDD